MKYLLDTNIVFDMLRNPMGRVFRAIECVGAGNVVTSIIVLAEVRFGIAKKRSERLARQLSAVLAGLEVLPWETPMDEIYGNLRADLEHKGTPISENDLLIAAHALAHGYTLVTADEREFGRVSKLKIQNWLR